VEPPEDKSAVSGPSPLANCSIHQDCPKNVDGTIHALASGGLSYAQ
jgi:hypothetical protein